MSNEFTEKGLVFYKLERPLPDITKHCGLLGEEIDGNFFNLKGSDLKDIRWERWEKTTGETTSWENVLVFETFDEQIIAVKGFDEKYKEFEMDYNKETDTLKIEVDGLVKEVTGFKDYTPPSPRPIFHLFRDDSMSGNGTRHRPLSVVTSLRPGTYRPVKKLINITEGETLPEESGLTYGERYLTYEKVNNFGMLYPYEGVEKIREELEASTSPWRIPTKEEWDKMLNHIELCDEDKTHGTDGSSKWLGRYAGKRLKDRDNWVLESEAGGSPTDEHRGESYLNFNVLPAGWRGKNDFDIPLYIGKEAALWTSTKPAEESRDYYIKGFQFDRSKVYQEVVAPETANSLRLVKDYHGTDAEAFVTLFGMTYETVVMPEEGGGSKVWLASNLAATNSQFKGVPVNDRHPSEESEIVTHTNHYYLNEWKGNRWEKFELNDGESVVLFTAKDPTDPTKEIVDEEWRNVKGVLTLATEQTYQRLKEMVEKLNQKIDIEIAERTAEDASLSNRLSVEGAERRAEDASLSERIATEGAERRAAVEDLSNRLAVEGAERQAEDTSLSNRLATEGAERQAEDASLSARILTERQERIDEDQAINQRIDVEKAERVNEDASLSQRIATEGAERQGEDAALSQRIADEATERASQDALLENKIATEELERKAAVEDLSNRLAVEGAERQAAVTDLSSRLAVEGAERQAAVTDLSSRLATEGAERQAAVTDLSNRLATEGAERQAKDIDLEKQDIKTMEYVISPTKGLKLQRNGGEEIIIKVDGSFGVLPNE